MKPLQFLTPAVMLGTAACLSATTSPGPRSSPKACLPASADSSAYFEELQRIATSSDSIPTLQRRVYRLELTTVNRTSWVTKEDDCRKAALVIDSVAGTLNSGRQVLMFKLGASYGAASPAYSSLHAAKVIFILDSSFKYLVHVCMGCG